LQVGLCHVSELSDEPVVDINSCYKAGDMVKAKILKVRFIFFQDFHFAIARFQIRYFVLK
jgi:exosome complex RNA-binding protein Csl4